jgi:CheY-like chemotaxis protein
MPFGRVRPRRDCVSHLAGSGPSRSIQRTVYLVPEVSVADSTPQLRDGIARILVVDDNRDAADSLGMVLRVMGAEVEVVYDGPTAIAAILRFRPKAVLLDLGMPEMDGLEVGTRIRCTAPDCSMRVIALTGWGSPAMRRRSEAAGFDDHWVKPVAPEQLQYLVSRCSEHPDTSPGAGSDSRDPQPPPGSRGPPPRE